MKLITLDFETYFADDYTLSKMTTEAYVRDRRFKTHCLSNKIEDRPATCVPAYSGMKNSALLAHHAHFDGLILSHHYDIKPAFWFDTLSMARLLFPHDKSHSLSSLAKKFNLPEKTVPYQLFKNRTELDDATQCLLEEGCKHDVELTYQIFKKMLPYMPVSELKIIDLTIRMFTEPALRLNRDLLQQHLNQMQDKKADALETLGVTKVDVGSADKFAALLRSLGVEPPVKISKTTGKEAYAFAKTDAGLKELLEHDNETVVALVEARLGTKSNIIETRSQRMLDMDSRGAMCVYLKYCGATITTRWSGGDKMNWQNRKRGSVLREAVIPPQGYVKISSDSSQIECRLLCWVAGQEDMLDKFRRKEDIYSEIASQFYGEKVDKSKPEKRGMGKQIILSCGFRAGADSIVNTARLGTYGPPVILTPQQGLAARNLYRSTHPRVKAFWEFCDTVALPALLRGDASFTFGKNDCLAVEGKRIKLPNGIYLDYSNLRAAPPKFGKQAFHTQTRKGLKNMHGGILTQNIIEGLSRAVLANAMINISKRYKVVVATHDDVEFLAPISEAQDALDFALNIMKTPMFWCSDIPLDAEGEIKR